MKVKKSFLVLLFLCSFSNYSISSELEGKIYLNETHSIYSINSFDTQLLMHPPFEKDSYNSENIFCQQILRAGPDIDPDETGGGTGIGIPIGDIDHFIVSIFGVYAFYLVFKKKIKRIQY